MDNFYIETQNLIIRTATPNDAAALARGRNTPFVQRHNLYGQSAESDVMRELQQYFTIALQLRATGEVIGCIYVKDDLMRYHVNCRELSGWLTEEHANGGLMTEALNGVIPALFKLGIQRLSTWVFAENVPSLKLMQKVGFVPEGVLREGCRRPNGQTSNVCLFSMDVRDYYGRIKDLADHNPQRNSRYSEATGLLQGKLLKDTLQLILQLGLPYGQKLKAAGISPDDINGIEDIVKLPFSDKNDLVYNCVRPGIVRLHATSGTSGRMRVIPCTQTDLDLFTEGLCRALKMQGCGPGSVVQNTFGFSMFVGGLGVQAAAERLGATVIPTSVGNTARQLQFIKDFKTTILCCTPSYALHIIAQKEKLGYTSADFALKSCFLAGERLSPQMAKLISEGLNAEVYDVYGSAEMTNVFAGCGHGAGKHIPEDMIYAEIVDAAGNPLPEGERGELVITTLQKTGLPLVRYRTHDVASITSSPCQCGRAGKRLMEVVGRTDELIIYKGCKIYPSQIEYCISRCQGLTGRYKILRDGELCVVAEGDCGDGEDLLCQLLKQVTGVKIAVKITRDFVADGNKFNPLQP